MKTGRVFGIPEKIQSELEAKYRKIEEKIPAEEPEEKKEKRGMEPLKSWVRDSMPEELRDDPEAIRIFQEISLEKVFQSIWNYEISIPEGLNDKGLRDWLFKKKEELGDLSGISLNLKEITPSKNILDETKKTKREIEFHKGTNKCPSKDTYDKAKSDRRVKFVFRNNASFYLRRKIMIEKLEEMLNLLKRYQPSL